MVATGKRLTQMSLVHLVGFVLSSCGIAHTSSADSMKTLLMNINCTVKTFHFTDILDQGYLPRAFIDIRHRT